MGGPFGASLGMGRGGRRCTGVPGWSLKRCRLGCLGLLRASQGCAGCTRLSADSTEEEEDDSGTERQAETNEPLLTWPDTAAPAPPGKVWQGHRSCKLLRASEQHKTKRHLQARTGPVYVCGGQFWLGGQESPLCSMGGSGWAPDASTCSAL